MDPVSFAALTRRASLMTLSAAGLAAAFAGPFTADAKKNKTSKKAKQRCQKQVGACRAALVDVCDGSAICEEALLPCCPEFKTCNAAAFVRCFWSAL